MRVLLYHPGISEDQKQQVKSTMLHESNITNASPAVLGVMLDTARERQQQAESKGQEEIAAAQRVLAGAIAQEIIGAFTETDYALDARMALADEAIAAARGARLREDSNAHYAEAIRHLGVIRAVYATQPQAAEALMLLGELYLQRKQYEEADQCYKDVLGYSDWKTEWAAALYGRGQVAEEQKQWVKASAYYERIYLMYGHYQSWASKAYVRRAFCLNKAYMKAKAIETLQAMLGSGEFEALPEAAEARALLAKLGGKETP